MGRLVKLPGQGKNPAPTDLEISPMKPDTNLGSHIDFTCITCQTKIKLELTNSVFKKLEFFCASCGAGWQVTNPVFALKRKGQR
jgi:hypothetical protein